MVDRVIKLEGRGLRGESFADIARRIGSVAGVPVSSSATDGQILDAMVDAAGESPSLLASVQLAQDNAALAELAALTAPGVYEDTTAGLAATSEGATFWVKEDDGLTLYRKVSGAAEMVDIISTTVDVRKYGADETGTSDSSTAFQLATDFVASRGGGVVFIPPGIYTLEGIELKDGVHYRGLSQFGTKLQLPASPSAHMFSAAPGENFVGGGFYDLEMDGGQERDTATYDAIDFSEQERLEEFHIESVYVHHFRRGYNGSWGGGPGNDRFPCIRFSRFFDNSIGVYTNEHALIVSCDLRANDVGLDGRINDLVCVMGKFNYNRVGISGNGNPITNSYFSTCTFFKNTEVGARIGSQCTITASMFVGSNNTEVNDGLGDVGILVYQDENNISGGNRFGEGADHNSFGGAGILIKRTSTSQTHYHVQIQGNEFLLHGEGVGIKTDLGTQVLVGAQIQGNNGVSDGKPFAQLERVSSLQVQNNHLRYTEAMGADEAWLSWTEFLGTNSITGNNVGGAGSSLATGHMLRGPTPAGGSGIEVLIADNHPRGFVAGPFKTVDGSGDPSDSSALRYRDNSAFRTENSGETSVLDGQTTRTVTHFLARTPLRQNITITPYNGTGAALAYYVANVTATTFDIVVQSAPSGANGLFTWQAHCRTI